MFFSYSGKGIFFDRSSPIVFQRRDKNDVFDTLGGSAERKPPFDFEIPQFFRTYFRNDNPLTIPIGVRTVIIVPNADGLQFAQSPRHKNQEPVIIGALQRPVVGTVKPMSLKLNIFFFFLYVSNLKFTRMQMLRTKLIIYKFV